MRVCDHYHYHYPCQLWVCADRCPVRLENQGGTQWVVALVVLGTRGKVDGLLGKKKKKAETRGAKVKKRPAASKVMKRPSGAVAGAEVVKSTEPTAAAGARDPTAAGGAIETTAAAAPGERNSSSPTELEIVEPCEPEESRDFVNVFALGFEQPS